MPAKRREGELLEVLVAVSQLSPGTDAFAEALGLVPIKRLLHTGGRVRDMVCALDLGMELLILFVFLFLCSHFYFFCEE